MFDGIIFITNICHISSFISQKNSGLSITLQQRCSTCSTDSTSVEFDELVQRSIL